MKNGLRRWHMKWKSKVNEVKANQTIKTLKKQVQKNATKDIQNEPGSRIVRSMTTEERDLVADESHMRVSRSMAN